MLIEGHCEKPKQTFRMKFHAKNNVCLNAKRVVKNKKEE